jgi:type II secretory pathway pseudopilin PulG
MANRTALRRLLLAKESMMRRERKRRAFTLVELAAVFAVLSVVTVGSYKLFIRLNDSMRITTKHELAVRETYRLSLAFRDDVRQASDVQVIEQGRTIRLINLDGAVQYGLTGRGITYAFLPRSDSSFLPRHDLFICPVDESMQCRLDPDSRLVALPVMTDRVPGNTQSFDFRNRPIELIERIREAP